MSRGIIVDTKDVEEPIPDFDTRRSRLQIAIQREPAHLDVLNVKGNNITANAGNNWFAKETLFTMEHGLGYKPRVVVYIYNAGNVAGGTGAGYAIGRFFYGFGAFDDQLTYEIDEETFSIIHTLEDFFSTDRTSNAASFGDMRIKYMLFSNPMADFTDPNLR